MDKRFACGGWRVACGVAALALFSLKELETWLITSNSDFNFHSFFHFSWTVEAMAKHCRFSTGRRTICGAAVFQLLFCLIFIDVSCLSFAWIRPPVIRHSTKLCSGNTSSEMQQSMLWPSSPLSLTLEDLSTVLDGKGRAMACWECFRVGVDPLWYHQGKGEREYVNEFPGWQRDEMDGLIKGNMGKKAINLLQQLKQIERDVASLVHVSTSGDGTTKLLLQLSDGLQVETVIIPWSDRQKSTLCISSQVGCRQGCIFCATGRMGKLRSLSSDEILAQVYWGNKACRLTGLYPIDNIVFMGLGEPGDNVEQVVRTTHILVDRQMFQLAKRRVTISTVGPTPETFSLLGEAPVVLAWSVHASRDEVRKQLVPTTKYTMEELREGLIQALVGRSKRLRTIMLEVTLLDGINDSQKDAIHLCEFSQVIVERVPGVKLVVNLIPWNDIGSSAGLPFELRQPSMERILQFQRVFINKGMFCYIRTTRGDDESAACGQLATKKRLQSHAASSQ